MWRKYGARDNLGQQVEAQAQRWLAHRGLTPLEKNYRCKAGEIDLVMRDGEALVFVEVRYRRQNRFGGGLESVDLRKQRKLLLAARHYLAHRKQYDDCPCRFDVLAASPAAGPGDKLEWQWIRDAFGL